MIGYYNYSVVLTYIGLITAMFGMVRSLGGDPQAGVLCLMICGLCDTFDGTIARRCKRTESEKRFGVEIDSLCDLVCFGVFPTVLGYAVGLRGWFWLLTMSFFVLAAVIRLGYFNVQEIERQNSGGGHRVHYEGLPVTSIALIAPVLLLLDAFVKVSSLRVYNAGLLVVGILFILKIKIRKPYDSGLVALAAVGLVIFAMVCAYGGRLTAP